MRKPRWYDRLQYVILYILGFVVIGIASLMTSEVGWAGLKEPAFYISQILTYVAIIFIIVATLLKIIDDFTNTNEQYLAAEEDITKFANNYVPVLFARYADYVNPKRKEKQFVANVKHQIRILLKGRKFLFFQWGKPSANDLRIWTRGTLEEKKANKFCMKVATLEVQLTKEWLEKNIETMDVDYDEITLDVVLGGYITKHSRLQANDFVTKHKGWRLFKEKSPKILFSFGFSTFAGAIIVDLALNPSAVLNIIVKTIVLIWNTIMTIRYAKAWTLKVTLKDIRFRKGVVNEYNKWIVQQAQKQTEEQAALKALVQGKAPEPTKEEVNEDERKEVSTRDLAPVN